VVPALPLRTNIQIIAPIMSMHGITNSTTVVLLEIATITANRMSAVQPHIVLTACLV
jgi:hypothetical protein